MGELRESRRGRRAAPLGPGSGRTLSASAARWLDVPQEKAERAPSSGPGRGSTQVEQLRQLIDQLRGRAALGAELAGHAARISNPRRMLSFRSPVAIPAPTSP